MVPSSKTVVPARQFATSLRYSLPIRRLKEIISRLLPDTQLDKVEEFKSTQLVRLHKLKMTDGRELILSLAPSLAVRLLRHENSMLASEAALVTFIETSTRAGQESSSTIQMKEDSSPTTTINLHTMIPDLLKHSSNTHDLTHPYSIFHLTPGTPLSDLAIYLSSPERASISHQIGLLSRHLASLISPSGTFGTIHRVIPAPGIAAANAGSGCESWSKAFHLLLEGMLRDGEDMAVLLPYEVIRNHYQRSSWRLDEVLVPRLVVLNVGDETNILIERTLASIEEPTSPLSVSNPAEVKVVGLRSWSQGIFGDPLLATCFLDPTQEFLKGWREAGGEVIEDIEGAEERCMLYRLFWSVTGVVTEYYRPRNDSSGRELEARRALTGVLRELERVDVEGGERVKRERSGSLEGEGGGEEGGAKRIKVEEE